MYYVGRNGRQSGPHSLDELKEMAIAGKLSPTDLTWTDGMGEWKPASVTLPDLMALVPVAPLPPAASAVASPDPAAPPPPAPLEQPILVSGDAVPSYMWQSVAMTLLCCPVTGVPAIVFASQVQSKQQHGDIAGALKASKSAKLWCWVSVAVGVIMYVLTAIGFVVLVGIANHMH